MRRSRGVCATSKMVHPLCQEQTEIDKTPDGILSYENTHVLVYASKINIYKHRRILISYKTVEATVT
jgi:hypothetical protein